MCIRDSAKGGTAAAEEETSGDSFGRKVYKDLMNGVSHMLPFVVGGGIMIALAFLLDDYTIDPSNFGMNTPVAAFFKTVGNAAFSYMPVSYTHLIPEFRLPKSVLADFEYRHLRLKDIKVRPNTDVGRRNSGMP